MAEGLARKGFDLDLKDGQIAERELRDLLAGKVEVKTDYKAHLTGNVFVEVEYRGQPSGLTSTEAPWWAFKLAATGVIVLVTTERLRELVKNRRRLSGGDYDRSTGYLLPLDRLVANPYPKG